MRIVLTLLLAVLIGAVASWAKVHAQTVTPPVVQQDDPNLEAMKKAAILRAYQLVRIPPVPLPVARPEDKNELDEQADLNMDDLRKFVRRANYKTDICARHHMRKVSIRGGKSWRCK